MNELQIFYFTEEREQAIRDVADNILKEIVLYCGINTLSLDNITMLKYEDYFELKEKMSVAVQKGLKAVTGRNGYYDHSCDALLMEFKIYMEEFSIEKKELFLEAIADKHLHADFFRSLENKPIEELVTSSQEFKDVIRQKYFESQFVKRLVLVPRILLITALEKIPFHGGQTVKDLANVFQVDENIILLRLMDEKLIAAFDF
jgi:hypothetical protein